SEHNETFGDSQASRPRCSLLSSWPAIYDWMHEPAASNGEIAAADSPQPTHKTISGAQQEGSQGVDQSAAPRSAPSRRRSKPRVKRSGPSSAHRTAAYLA